MIKAAKAIDSAPCAALPSKSQLTRQRIIDAAARVFATRGYAHTRLSDIALEAGSHAGGIYYYFASREALVDEVMRIATQRSIDQLEAALGALPASATAAERIIAAVTTQLAGIMENDAYNIAHNRIHAQIPEDLRARHAPLLRQYFAIWRRMIADGQASGEIRADIDAAVLRLALSGSIQWATEWANTEHGSPDVLARKMAAIFLNGILARPAN